MKRTHFGVVALALLMGARIASAATITFTESTIATGSLGASSFVGSLVTLTATGDTSSVLSGTTSELFVAAVSINVALLGETASLTGTADVFSCRASLNACAFSPTAGITDDSGVVADILDTVSGAFSTYDLTTSIGPVTVSSLINPPHSFGTELGLFQISSAGNATFTATLETATPEPGTAAFLGLGLAGLGALVCRKRNRRGGTREHLRDLI
jgi:PEP-CTERM motif